MKLSQSKHWIHTARANQVRLNALAVDGGRPYIDARLWRAPNETDISWNGDAARGVVGRRDRTALVNDAGRIANKINQYIFKVKAERNGIDERFANDCTGNGESIHDFMQRVNTAVTYGRWCWIQVDRAPLALGDTETLADKSPLKTVLWDAADIPAWSFGDNGEILWLITRSRLYINADPEKEPVDTVIHTLYQKIDGRVYITEESEKDLPGVQLRTREELPGLDRIPFVLVGRPSAKAWWFDDVENIQCQILNLDSMHNETLTETVYPQLVVPTSLANSLEVKLREEKINGEKVVALLKELTIGRKVPIVEGAEDKGISRYITPSGDLKLLTEEGTRKRALLFDMAGLALFNKETRQIQTAESKQFDQLDTNSTLANRALLLQDAEKHIVELAQVFDPSFGEYDPVYPSDFDVVDVSALGQAITQAANLPNLTPKVQKITAKIGVRLLKELASGSVPEEEFTEALKEIDETDFTEQPMLPDPFAKDDGYTPYSDDDALEIFSKATGEDSSRWKVGKE